MDNSSSTISLSSLPLEMKCLILDHLSIKGVINVSVVCKLWNEISINFFHNLPRYLELKDKVVRLDNPVNEGKTWVSFFTKVGIGGAFLSTVMPEILLICTVPFTGICILLGVWNDTVVKEYKKYSNEARQLMEQ